MNLDFGLNPKDERPQKPCDHCGLIDASVLYSMRFEEHLCTDCYDLAQSNEGDK